MEELMIGYTEMLCGLPGVSGDEGAVRKAILAQIQKHCDGVETDALGNLIVFKKGRQTPEKTLLLSAHMDEVGFQITFIEDSGLLRFTSVGGIDTRVIVGKGVEIGPKKTYGVIGTKAIHLQKESEQNESLPLDKLYIDIGADSADAARQAVALGDRAVFATRFRRMGEDRLLGRALDDRAGCAILMDLLRRELPWDTTFAFTVQEEVGCIGAQTVGYRVGPDIAIVVETTTASDIAGVEPDKVVCRLGAGPVLSFMDRGTVYDADLYRAALGVAKDKGIPCQSKAGVYGGNEARSIQTAREGARMLAVSLPCRYLHSPACMLKASDILHTRDLLLALLETAGEQ